MVLAVNPTSAWVNSNSCGIGAIWRDDYSRTWAYQKQTMRTASVMRDKTDSNRKMSRSSSWAKRRRKKGIHVRKLHKLSHGEVFNTHTRPKQIQIKRINWFMCVQHAGVWSIQSLEYISKTPMIYQIYLSQNILCSCFLLKVSFMLPRWPASRWIFDMARAVMISFSQLFPENTSSGCLCEESCTKYSKNTPKTKLWSYVLVHNLPQSFLLLFQKVFWDILQTNKQTTNKIQGEKKTTQSLFTNVLRHFTWSKCSSSFTQWPELTGVKVDFPWTILWNVAKSKLTRLSV